MAPSLLVFLKPNEKMFTVINEAQKQERPIIGFVLSLIKPAFLNLIYQINRLFERLALHVLRHLYSMVTECFRMLLLTLSTLRSNPDNTKSIFWFIWLLCVAPDSALTGDHSLTRWKRNEWVEYSEGR